MLETMLLEEQEIEEPISNIRKSLNLDTFNGVFVPCTSSILGAVLFLRLSWAVGEAGWWNVMLMFAVGMLVNLMTALSLAAISTNGIMKGGGAYFMISRSIGPEFGVSTGLIYTVALSVGASFSLMAFSENVLDSFLCQKEPCSLFHENHQWLGFTIASATLFGLTCLIVVAGPVMDKLNTMFTSIMLCSVLVGIISLLASNGVAELSIQNFKSNMVPDYTDGHEPGTIKDGYQTFLTVFVIVFPAMTGVMAGANYSGDLRDPGHSIGRGTLGGLGFTSVLYIFLILLFGASFDRHTLQTNKSVFQESCFLPFFIIVGIISCTLSSALGTLMGASRVLQAVARDRLIPVLDVFSMGAGSTDEPRAALAFCWLISQLCLLYGNLDAVAAVITDCFLLVYFFLNLACFALKVTGAPNFRPRFSYFSWHTAFAGAVTCLFVMFVTSPVNALVALCATGCFAYYVHITAQLVPWGDVTQAMIFHQVRKFLLRLDARRSHPKFWRPSILFVPFYQDKHLALLDFCNSLKKGGLYVVANILVNDNGVQNMENVAYTCNRLKVVWGELLDHSKMKGFYEIMIASDLVSGMRSLLVAAGLGGLRPNTVCIQFFQPNNANKPDSSLDISASQLQENYVSLGTANKSTERLDEIFYLLGQFQSHKKLENCNEMVHYCEILADTLILEKNLLIARHFSKLNKSLIMDYKRLRKRRHSSFSRSFRFAYRPGAESDTSLDDMNRFTTIDLWSTDECDWGDPCGALALQMQLAFGLHRTEIWEDHTKLRVIAACQSVPGQSQDQARRAYDTLKKLLIDIRVEAEVLVLPSVGAALFEEHRTHPLTETEHCAELNAMVIEHSSDKACVVFLPLPRPPSHSMINHSVAADYIENLEILTQGLPPTILCAPGANIAPIVTTEL